MLNFSIPLLGAKRVEVWLVFFSISKASSLTSQVGGGFRDYRQGFLRSQADLRDAIARWWFWGVPREQWKGTSPVFWWRELRHSRKHCS